MESGSLRVTIVGINYAPEPTGNAPYTRALAEALVARGHSVTVVTTPPHYPEWRIREGYGQWRHETTEGGVRVVRLRHFVPKSPLGAQRLISEISFGMRAMFTRWYAPDVVLLVSPALFSSAIARWKARFLVRRPIGTWVQDLYSLGIVETGVGGGRVAAIVARVERQVLRDSDGVAAIHDRFAAVMTERLGVDPASITVIRNWTHLPPAPVVDAAAVRARHGWGDETVVLHAGNQGAKQALENVVAAARIADDRALPIRFVLLGDGNQRDELETLSIGISRIQFISPLPGIEFQEAMAGSDVLLVNERVGVTEMAVPSKLTSYFSMGKPVLAATDEGSVTAGEIAASEGGIRVDAGRPIALLEAIRSLADDPDRARALGEAGRRFMERTLSEAAAVDRYEAWLASLSARR